MIRRNANEGLGQADLRARARTLPVKRERIDRPARGALAWNAFLPVIEAVARV
eukprot:CAMPEP_0119415940 /NCGR_PEP_ID=MMETSP1335-20130426/11007_1 /TAXON_ID=259385 /ORGANISM="Chrysoculter rhomboideus, Strain RCC1486" /LENGTH=52 /DNA_ID=CAMNT_0007441001 /DNA_START=565 /DNA_END=723 /DNA_ORIENTATION=+